MNLKKDTILIKIYLKYWVILGSNQSSEYLYPKGVFHLEKTYDELLKGKPGKIFNEVNSRGKVIREISIEEPIKGNNFGFNY